MFQGCVLVARGPDRVRDAERVPGFRLLAQGHRAARAAALGRLLARDESSRPRRLDLHLLGQHFAGECAGDTQDERAAKTGSGSREKPATARLYIFHSRQNK